MLNKRLTPQQAWEKIKYYCAYQERSHEEAKTKLYSFGIGRNDVEELLSRLIEENYLNEERFARLFAGGKFRMKKWGRIKIKNELKLKKVSAYNIKVAMSEIDEEEYQKILEKLVSEKWTELKSEQYLVRQMKTVRYMMQKGYESNLVSQAIQKLRENA